MPIDQRDNKTYIGINCSDYFKIEGTLKSITSKKTNENKTKKEITMDERLPKLRETCIKLGFEQKETIANCALQIWITEQQIKQQEIANNHSKRSSSEQGLNNSLNMLRLGLGIMNMGQPKLTCKPDVFGNVKCY